jgi:hypothetical protein
LGSHAEAMKHKKLIFPISFVVCACLITSIVGGQLLFKRCLWWNCAPTRTFDVIDLSLPSILFPADSQYNPIYYDSDDNLETITSGIQAIYWKNGSSGYHIDRYATYEDAKKEYEWTKGWFFENGNTKIQWDEYVLIYKSSFADEFYSACGVLIANDYRCAMAAQYQEFHVFFNTTITEEMTHEDFQRVVRFIDEQMGKYLYGK